MVDSDREVLEVDEAARRLAEIDASYKKAARLFFAGAVAAVLAVVAAFTKPVGAAVLGAVAAACFVAWSARRKSAPPPIVRMRAEIELARAEIGRMRAALEAARAPKR